MEKADIFKCDLCQALATHYYCVSSDTIELLRLSIQQQSVIFRCNNHVLVGSIRPLQCTEISYSEAVKLYRAMIIKEALLP